ncbi:MAG TPA: transglycosylase SLT domain-containing protein [Candidatus Eisenbacteria bacterium]|nr:transglycosylase SLT domain-containing protein [Candidatus Eisenbacteria bacterium]
MRRATLPLSATIPTPPRASPTNASKTLLWHRHSCLCIRATSNNSKSRGTSRSYQFWALSCLALTIFSFFFSLTVVAQTHKKRSHSSRPKPTACAAGCRPETTAPALDAQTPQDAAAQKELAGLARDLRRGAPGSYDQLAAFANKNSSSLWGQRAALALGYDDFSKNRNPQALAWLQKAQADPLLREYTLFWTAQTERAMNKNSAAAQDFAQILKDYPGTALKEQLLEAYVPTAVAVGRPQDALDALSTYPPAGSKPSLLLARARANEAAHKLVPAAKDYQALYYKYPLADESKEAAKVLPRLNHQLHGEFPYATGELQDQRAQIFFDAHKWREARLEYEKLTTILKDPSNPTRQRALVREAESRQHPKAAPYLFSRLKLTDPEADAERLYDLSQAWRSNKNEVQMLTAIETVAEKYPQSRWTEESLMAAGNYYWVLLDRAKAANYYQRVLENFPAGKNAYNAEWRIAWVAYIQRQPYADEKMTIFLRKYPLSGGAVNALYWLGRNAERSGNPAHARAYYQKALDRFPTTYFANAAELRLAKLPAGDPDPVDALLQIPPASPPRPFDEPIPATVAERWNRAQALRTIAFDSSAELELKAAYAATASPRFLIEAAQAAFDQGHFASGMNYGRLAVPSFDSRKFSAVPVSVWKVLFPFPYESIIRREAARNDFDPMFAAGLIRQESTFQADAVSHANAIGLMQLLPKTARKLAREHKMRYSRAALFDPEVNIKFGMLYIADLTRDTGSPEYAAAAYNAGEDRIALWKSERDYEEVPELVESIPFTETREYVQIVLRNAEMYRTLYGDTPKSTVSAATPALSLSPVAEAR